MNHNYVFNNINDALPVLLRDLLDKGQEIGSRNGATKELAFVGITLANPLQRELTLVGRKHNLAAQIAETMWVLAGRNDIGWLSHYLPRAASFSDDGIQWRAGYGPRLRRWNGAQETHSDGCRGCLNGAHEDRPEVGVDQLAYVVDTLRKDPASRQAVATIWDPAVDTESGKDIACNNWLHFLSRNGELDLHVGIRSNDAMWGWSGINAFEWSVLLELVASMTALTVGKLHFSTSSFHLYETHWAKARRIADAGPESLVLTESLTGNAGTQIQSISDLDDEIKLWFECEEYIRTGTFDEAVAAVQHFDGHDRMFHNWLKVLVWYWHGGHRQLLSGLYDTHLGASAQMGVKPPQPEPEVDIYAAVAEQRGISREEAKKFLLTTMYSGRKEVVIPEGQGVKWNPGPLVIMQDEIRADSIKVGTLVPPSVTPESMEADDELNRDMARRQAQSVYTPFLQHTIATHNDKHAAYGDSWKRRGEPGILGNIARKVDRLGRPETDDETSADTAMDLFVYLAKYRCWLDAVDDKDALVNGADPANRVMAVVEGNVNPGRQRDRMFEPKKYEERIIYLFSQELEQVAQNYPDTALGSKIATVDSLLAYAYKLAYHLFDNDDYRGADAD